MATLFDVSRMITLFQRLCSFAEEFTEEHRPALLGALTKLFREDLEESEELPNVDSMITSLLRRLRRTLESLIEAETELIIAVKENTEFTNLREELTKALREAFDQARTECRNHFGRLKADIAGFPARLAVNSSAIIRQAKVVSMKMRQADFDLGQPLISNSTATVETILEIFESKVDALHDAMSKAMRRRARIQGKQVAKDKEMSDFRTTYSLFVSMVRSSFRLAGEAELAKRLTLNQPRRTAATPSEDPPSPPQDPDPDEPGEIPEPTA